MIYSDSRYAKGLVLRAEDARNGSFKTAVYRKFPNGKVAYFYYTWVEGDRIDRVAQVLLGTPGMWWKIMDLNPDIIDPFSIPIGTTLRIPSV